MIKHLLSLLLLTACASAGFAQIPGRASTTVRSPAGTYMLRVTGMWYEGWTSPVQATLYSGSDTLWSKELTVWSTPIVNDRGVVAFVSNSLVTLSPRGDTLNAYAPPLGKNFFADCADCFPEAVFSHDGEVLYILLEYVNTYTLALVAIDVGQGEQWSIPISFDERGTPIGATIVPFRTGLLAHNHNSYGLLRQCYLIRGDGTLLAQYITSEAWGIQPRIFPEENSFWILHREDIRAYSVVTGRFQRVITTDDLIAISADQKQDEDREWILQAVYYKLEKRYEELSSDQRDHVRALIEKVDNATARDVWKQRLLGPKG